MQHLQTGQRGRRAELVAGKAVAVEEGLELVVFAEEGIEDGLRGQRGGHRQVAAGQPFGQRHEIRLHALVVAGEEGEQRASPDSGAWAREDVAARRTRPPKAGHNFIRNQQRAVAAGDLGGAA